MGEEKITIVFLHQSTFRPYSGLQVKNRNHLKIQSKAADDLYKQKKREASALAEEGDTVVLSVIGYKVRSECMVTATTLATLSSQKVEDACGRSVNRAEKGKKKRGSSQEEDKKDARSRGVRNE